MANLLARGLPIVAALVATAALCSPASPGATRVPPGTWGGEHIVLEVASAEARAEFDCAHGTVDEALELDVEGRFDAKGTYVKERPGPQREDEPATGEPARYSGRVRGSTMTLTITLTNTGKTVGPFTLTHGKTPRLTKCA